MIDYFSVRSVKRQVWTGLRHYQRWKIWLSSRPSSWSVLFAARVFPLSEITYTRWGILSAVEVVQRTCVLRCTSAGINLVPPLVCNEWIVFPFSLFPQKWNFAHSFCYCHTRKPVSKLVFLSSYLAVHLKIWFIISMNLENKNKKKWFLAFSPSSHVSQLFVRVHPVNFNSKINGLGLVGLCDYSNKRTWSLVSVAVLDMRAAAPPPQFFGHVTLDSFSFIFLRSY